MPQNVVSIKDLTAQLIKNIIKISARYPNFPRLIKAQPISLSFIVCYYQLRLFLLPNTTIRGQIFSIYDFSFDTTKTLRQF